MLRAMLRRWFGARALLFHLLLVLIVAGCLYAGWWQVHRAMAGNTLSYFYSVEWPVFAIVAVIGWWQLIHESREEVEARKAERRRRGRPTPVAWDRELLRRELAARPELVQSFPELAGAFPELVAAGGTGETGTSPAEDAPVDLVPAGAAQVEVMPADARPRPRHDGPPSAAAENLRAYNDALAALAATGRAKSWRNPRGRSRPPAQEPPADQDNR